MARLLDLEDAAPALRYLPCALRFDFHWLCALGTVLVGKISTIFQPSCAHLWHGVVLQRLPRVCYSQFLRRLRYNMFQTRRFT